MSELLSSAKGKEEHKMISLLRNGQYLLGETSQHTRILYLDDQCYVWLFVPSIGDILSYTAQQHEIKTELSSGDFRLYDVKSEADLIDLQHLELHTSRRHWQGYLLLTGLPRANKKRSRIIPTKETVADIKHQIRGLRQLATAS